MQIVTSSVSLLILQNTLTGFLGLQVTEFVATRKYDDERIRVSIKRVSELAPYSETRLHVYNVMMRQILADLEMKEVQRAYFSPKGAVVLRNHK